HCGSRGPRGGACWSDHGGGAGSRGPRGARRRAGAAGGRGVHPRCGRRDARGAGVARDAGEGRVTLRSARRAGLGAGTMVLLASGWWGAPRVLERLEFFRVRQIELVGVKNLAPDAVIAALRLPPDASVFTDTRLLGDRLRGLAGVAEVHVVRQLPAALRIELREVEPAALAPRGSGPRGGPLVAVDAEGRPLPFDPARTGLDLPVAAAADP